jgi:hypothetical protein
MSDTFTIAFADLKEKIGDMEINADTIIQILRFAMEVVETTQVKGAEQKELVIKLVRQVVVEAPITDEKEKLLLDMIDHGVLGNTVDLVVMASKGELDVNAIVAVATGCCAAFIKRK